MKKKYIDYFFEFFEKNSIPKLFSGIHSSDNKRIENDTYDKDLVDNPNTIYSVFFIPDYLTPIFDSKNLVVKKVSQFFKGYAIFLDGFTSADAYIKHRFRSNAKGIRRRIKRLESCFDISYKTYYGAIKEEEYEFLMNSLEKMLIRRFEERNDTSQSLLRWEHYKKMYFSLINEKKASLFVVLAKGEPIVVSLNHLFEGRLFSSISSYDIDYSKFSLGSVEIYKKLDWLIENNYASYEMGMGDLSYKREWCNHIYNFEHQIIYPKKSLIGFIKGNLEYLKVKSKEYIFKKAYLPYKKYKAKKKEKNIINTQEYKALSIEELKYTAEYPSVDYRTKEFLFLRRMVFDFLYTSIDHIDNVSVVRNSENNEEYLILGKAKMQKVILSK